MYTLADPPRPGPTEVQDMSTKTYSIGTADEELIKWIELEIDSRFYVTESHEMAVDCLRVLKLRFPGAEDPVNEAAKDDTYNRVVESRARIFGAVSKEKIRSMLGH